MKWNKTILCIFVFSLLLLLVNCIKEEGKKVILCDDFPNNKNCTCPNGLIKKARIYTYDVDKSEDYMYHCINQSCSDFGLYSLNNTCVESCPKEYTYVEIYDAPEHKHHILCFFIRNQSEMICPKFPNYNKCTCPDGQKVITTMGGSNCVDESFCLDYTLSDNESVCVKECPPEYIPLSITDVGVAGACINVKKIDKDNYWVYANHILRTSNLSFMKKYNRDCWIIDEMELEDRFEIKLKCNYDPVNCLFYIFSNTSIQDGGCLNNTLK